MKSLRQMIRLLAGGVFVSALLASFASTGYVSAQGPAANHFCDAHFLTFPAWYNGVNKSEGVQTTPDKSSSDLPGCSIASPTDVGGLSVFIWTIALNIVEILLNVVGYASVGFIIYGGIKYIYSAGSPNGMVSARKTIMNAVIGLVLSILSVAIVNTIAGSLK